MAIHPTYLTSQSTWILGTIVSLVVACSSTTKEGAVDADRKQFMLIPNSQILQMSADAYEQTKVEAKQKGTLNRSSQQVARVREIAKRIIPQTSVFRKDAPGWAWDVNVITSNELNAYCMPGGKIIFYSGIIDKLQLSDGEIAAIMGHEIAHALREHGRERMSEALVQQIGLQVLVGTGKVKREYAGALALVTNLAISLPHSRGQESEADDIGVELMARAGYDPNEAVQLWQKMARSGGQKPPEILSTHPADASRIKRIQSLIPKVMPFYQATQG